MIGWTGLKATGVESSGVRRKQVYQGKGDHSPEMREQMAAYERGTKAKRSQFKKLEKRK